MQEESNNHSFIISTEINNYCISILNEKLMDWRDEVIHSFNGTCDDEVYELLSIMMFIDKKSIRENPDDMIFGLDRLAFLLEHSTLNFMMLQKLQGCIVIKETLKSGIKCSDKSIQIIKDSFQRPNKLISSKLESKKTGKLSLEKVTQDAKRSKEILKGSRRAPDWSPSYYEAMEECNGKIDAANLAWAKEIDEFLDGEDDHTKYLSKKK